MEDMFEKLKAQADDIEIPEGVKPENMMSKINNYSRRKVVSVCSRFAVIAACLAAMVLWSMGPTNLKDYEKSMHTTEPETTVQGEKETESAKVEETTKEGESTTKEQPTTTKEAETEQATTIIEEPTTVVEPEPIEPDTSKVIKEDKKEDRKILANGFTSKKEIYKYLKDECEVYVGGYTNSVDVDITTDAVVKGEGSVEGDMFADADAATDGVTSDSADTSVPETEYVDTNVRTEGIDEADVVKTDGSYIYMLDRENGKIDIYAVSNVDKKATTVKLKIDEGQSEEFYARDMFVTDNKIVVVCEVEILEASLTTSAIEGSYFDYYSSLIEKTYVLTYDITDKKDIKKVGEVMQDGIYLSSRMVDGYMYILSEHWLYDITKNDCVPEIDGKDIKAGKVLVSPQTHSARYTVITSVNVDNPDKVIDSRAICASSGESYMSTENLFIYEHRYVNNKERTYIFKIAYSEGKFGYEDYGRVKGVIKDQFCIDEYNGYLRVIAEEYDEYVWVESTRVYVLDDTMEVVGRINGIAEGEELKSVRFMGDMGYFVTFENTDPLFSVDFSNPENPEIVGELKVTGFSDYLHVWEENMLLGIGEEIDEDTGEFLGIKISMFDISDPANVTEVNRIILKEAYYTPAFDNHHAVLISGDKNVIGFVAGTYSEVKYYLLSYNADGFVVEEKTSIKDMENTRGLYIDEHIYIAQPGIGIDCIR